MRQTLSLAVSFSRSEMFVDPRLNPFRGDACERVPGFVYTNPTYYNG